MRHDLPSSEDVKMYALLILGSIWISGIILGGLAMYMILKPIL